MMLNTDRNYVSKQNDLEADDKSIENDLKYPSEKSRTISNEAYKGTGKGVDRFHA